MGEWISVNRVAPKLPRPMSFLNSWRFPIRQICKLVAKSEAVFGEG